MTPLTTIGPSHTLPRLVRDDTAPDGILGGTLQVLAEELLELPVPVGQHLQQVQ
jgi:hypothetical protein